MRQHTPEELEEAKRILKAVEPYRKQMEAATIAEQRKQESTIETLHRRTRTQTIDLPLEGGDTIAIFSRLSQADGAIIEDIEQERLDLINETKSLMGEVSADISTEQKTQLHTRIVGLLDQASDCYLKIIAKITVDPELTFDWLKENPDKYNAEDIIDTYYAFRESRRQQVLERNERVKQIISFREHQTRPGVQPVPKVDEHSRPT